MQKKRLYEKEIGEQRKGQSRLLNGLLGEETITYSELMLGLKEFRPHYTNCKHKKGYKSAFNKKFIKRYEHLSFLAKNARYDSKFNNSLIAINIIAFLILQATRNIDFALVPLTYLFNLLVSVLIAFYMYKAIVVGSSINALKRGNIDVSGGVSFVYVLIALINLIIIFKDVQTIHITHIVPILITVIAITVNTKRTNHKMPVITLEERKEEKKNAFARSKKTLYQVAQTSFIKMISETSRTHKTLNIVKLDDFRDREKDASKFLNRRKSR